MRTISEQTVGRTDGALSQSSRIIGLTRVLGGILFLALLHCPSQARSAPGLYSVALAWDASSNLAVTGYRVYYGVASGNYTNSVTVGNVTTNTVPGLASGVTYFFATTAYTASGQESPFSNEISFVPGNPTIYIRVLTNRQAVLTLNGLIGSTYQILTSTNLTTWTVLGTVTLGASGSTNFTDTNAASFPKRYYRTRDTQP